MKLLTLLFIMIYWRIWKHLRANAVWKTVMGWKFPATSWIG